MFYKIEHPTETEIGAFCKLMKKETRRMFTPLICYSVSKAEQRGEQVRSSRNGNFIGSRW